MFSNRCPQCHPDDLYWTGTIIVSVTIAADGAIKDAQARINKGVPAHFYRSDTLLNLSRRPCPRLDSVLRKKRNRTPSKWSPPRAIPAEL
jgi:hypothetical protein